MCFRGLGTINFFRHHRHICIAEFFNRLYIHNSQYRIAFDVWIFQCNTIAGLDSAASLTRFKIGTGQNKPDVVFIF